MSIVLDTGVFFRPALVRSLGHAKERVVVPAVVLAERARQMARQGRPFSELVGLIEDARFEIEPFGVAQAAAVAHAAPDDDAWRRHARDAMIAAYLRPGDVLWTTNPRDFLALGVPAAAMRAV